MISTTGFRIAVQDQENKEAALTARKGVGKSVRKPLGDRGVNQTPLLKTKSLKECNIYVQNVPKEEAVLKRQVKNTHPEWYADVCSFKSIEDDYEDICLKSDRLEVKGLLNFMINPKTPPYKTNPFFTPVFQSPMKKMCDNYDDEDLFEIPIMDVELPKFYSL